MRYFKRVIGGFEHTILTVKSNFFEFLKNTSLVISMLVIFKLERNTQKSIFFQCI